MIKALDRDESAKTSGGKQQTAHGLVGMDSPLALEVGQGDLLELTVLKDGGGREGRGGLLNKCLGHVD